MGGVAFAQHPEGNGTQRREGAAVKAAEKTERMAERYGLNPEQKAELLELNKKHEAGALRPARRPFPGEMPPGQRPEGAPEGFRGERPPFPGGETPQRPGPGIRTGDGPRPPFMGPDREGFTKEDLKAEQKEYRKSLKKIMTKNQFKLYKKDVKNRKKARFEEAAL